MIVQTIKGIGGHIYKTRMNNKSLELGNYLLEKISKIDGLAFVHQETQKIEIMSPSETIDLNKLLSLFDRFSPFANKMKIYLDNGGFLFLRKLEDQHLVIYAKSNIYAALNIYLNAFLEDLDNDSQEEDTEVNHSEDQNPLPVENANPQESKVSESVKTNVLLQGVSKPKPKDPEVVSTQRLQKRVLRQNNVHDYFDHSIFYNQPANYLGGDFFWIRQRQNLLVMVLTDCHIENKSGTLLTLYLNTYLEEYNYAEMFSFDHFYQWVNKVLNAQNLENINNEEHQINAHLSIVVWDKDQQLLQIHNKGNGLIIKNETGEIQSTPPGSGVESYEVKAAGTWLLLHTDGIEKEDQEAITELFENNEIKSYNDPRLSNIISKDRFSDFTLVGFNV